MKYETMLPQDFDGVFKFTNWSDEEFVGIWNKKEYHFPPQATSPMIIPEHSPLEIQHIRKKFARDLAEREWFKGLQYEGLRKSEGEKLDGIVVPRLNSIHQAGTYTLDNLKDGIQKCLKPTTTVTVANSIQLQTFPLKANSTKNFSTVENMINALVMVRYVECTD